MGFKMENTFLTIYVVLNRGFYPQFVSFFGPCFCKRKENR